MNIIIVGGNGKLGKNIYNLLTEKQYKAFVVDLNTSVKNLNNINKSIKYDAIIDVSNHKNSLKSLDFAKQLHIPIIIGCTGHTKEELIKIKTESAFIPVFLAYNFSIALQYFYKAIETLSNLNSINHITEFHHINKKDKPSGTAKEIENIINKNSFVQETFSIRAGNVIGKHVVDFICENEQITISHEVFDRNVFSQGALFALTFITKQKKGLFTMLDAIKTQNN